MSDIALEVAEVSGELAKHIREGLVRDTEMSDQLKALQREVEELKESTTKLVTMWEQARGMLTLVKWCASIVGALASVYLYMKGK